MCIYIYLRIYTTSPPKWAPAQSKQVSVSRFTWFYLLYLLKLLQRPVLRLGNVGLYMYMYFGSTCKLNWDCRVQDRLFGLCSGVKLLEERGWRGDGQTAIQELPKVDGALSRQSECPGCLAVLCTCPKPAQVNAR